MTSVSIFRIAFVLISALTLSELASAQERSLNLQLSDLQRKPVPNVRVGVTGHAFDVTDRNGRAVIRLNGFSPQPKAEVFITIASEKWILISPWDGRIRTQLVDENLDTPIRILIAERGDRQMLKERAALVAMASKIIGASFSTADEDGKGGDTRNRRQKVLRHVARTFRLNSTEVDQAIRKWGRQSTDAYERGLAALYIEDYSSARELLKQSSAQRQIELGSLQVELINTSVVLAKSLYEQKRYLDSVESFRRAQKLKPGDATILDGLGLALIGAGKFEDAEVVYKELLDIIKASSGPDHPSYAAALVHLASTYALRGNYRAAEPLFLQALSIQKIVFGTDAREVANTLNTLGLTYRSLGDLEKAEACFQQAVTVFERMQELNPEEMAVSLTNLGSIYYARNHYAKAEEMYNRALVLLEKLRGTRDAELHGLLNNLAAVYYVQGDYDKALVVLQRVVTIAQDDESKQPNLVRALNNLANVYSALGDTRAALQYYERALGIWRKLGDRYGEALTLAGIGSVYDSLGEPQKALDVYMTALPLHRAIGDLRGTAVTLNNIGSSYSSRGQLQRALEYYQQAMLLYRAVADRSGEAMTLNNIGVVYTAEAKYAQAEQLYEQSLEISKNIFGGEDASAAEIMTNLAALYRKQAKYVEAEKMYLRAIEILERTSSGDNLELATMLVNLAETFSSHRKYDEAKPFLERALTIFEKVVGKDDVRTLSVRARLTAETIITVIEPATNAATVGSAGVVRGTITSLPQEQHLWVLLRRKDITGWWPQVEATIDREAGTWETSAVFGVPADLGKEFEIAVIIVSKHEHVKLKKYFDEAAEKSWPPIQMPSTVQPPVFRTARKIRNN